MTLAKTLRRHAAGLAHSCANLRTAGADLAPDTDNPR
jgi:hypothetical protein